MANSTLPDMNLTSFGTFVRKDGTRLPLRFIYEIEENKAQVSIGNDFFDINESYSSLLGWQSRRNTIVTEK